MKYLNLIFKFTDFCFIFARTLDPNFPQKVRELFEYRAAKEGYWTSEKFMLQLEKAFKIAEFKYYPVEFTVVWLSDQSSCHKAFASDASRWRTGSNA